MNNNMTIDRTFNAELDKAYKPLTHEVETALICKAQQGSKSARNALINSQLRKLGEIARSYAVKNSSNTVAGLMSIGIVGHNNANGLDRAIQQFDISRGTRFITFALQFMMNAIRDYSLDNKLVRIPRNKSKSRPNDPELIEQYTHEAECYNMTLDDYIKYKAHKGEPITLRAPAYKYNTSSLDSPIGEDDKTKLGDVLADNGVDMDQHIILRELKNALNTLSPDERRLIHEHFNGEMSMTEIGENRKISRQAVSTRIDKILTKARSRYGNVPA